MNYFIKGITYSYNRNIGWQDRTIRTLIGIAATAAAIYFYKTHFTASVFLGILAGAQILTVTTAKCIICYFTGQCTITSAEKRSLDSRGIKHE